MNSFLEKYRQLKNNRRIFSLVKLGLWILFFGIMFLIIYIPSGNNTSTYKPTTTNNTNNQGNGDEIVTNYYFDYKINDLDYTGTYMDGIIEIIGTDYSFYISNNSILSDREDATILDYTYLNINKFYELISKSELESEKNYKDGKEEYEYSYKENEKEINIKYVKNTDKSIEAVITYDDINIEINYHDINKAEISFDKDKYIYNIEVENEY